MHGDSLFGGCHCGARLVRGRGQEPTAVGLARAPSTQLGKQVGASGGYRRREPALPSPLLCTARRERGGPALPGWGCFRTMAAGIALPHSQPPCAPCTPQVAAAALLERLLEGGIVEPAALLNPLPKGQARKQAQRERQQQQQAGQQLGGLPGQGPGPGQPGQPEGGSGGELAYLEGFPACQLLMELFK